MRHSSIVELEKESLATAAPAVLASPATNGSSEGTEKDKHFIFLVCIRVH